MNMGMFFAVRVVPLLLLAACSSNVPAPELRRAGEACDQTPEPHRWIDAGVPDVGARPPLLSAHRGGIALAPENTLAAFRHAFAYGMDFIEVDVRETADGVFVVMHDATVDRTTDGSGPVSAMTWAQIQTLNAADFVPWKNSEYDPSAVPRLEQVLDLARSAGRGIEFDIKAVRTPNALFDLVASYGLMSRSFFSIDDELVASAQAYNPEIRVIFNIDGTESAADLFSATSRTAIFGSRRARYTPEKIAAVHDGCSFVLPHSYDSTEASEADEFRLALADGADGAQVNQPDVIAAVAERRIAAELVHLQQQRKVCLRNTSNGFGLPRRLLQVRVVRSDVNLDALTDRDGCIQLPQSFAEFVIRHEDSPAVQGAHLRVRTGPP